MLFNEKNAIVTGGASGINRCVVEKLAAGGAQVLIGDINKEGGAIASALRAKNQKVDYVHLDLTSHDSVKEFAAAALSKLGNVHILVNGAGWSKNTPFVQTTDEFWDKVLSLNLVGPMRLTKLMLPQMFEQKQGKIVFVSSDAGRVGSLGEAVYSAAKAGLIGLTKAVAREGARFNVTCNCVCPGPTDTPLFREVEPKYREAFIKAIPLRRAGKPEEIADPIVFFCSPQSDYITGQVLSASGGLTMVG
ncbi:MAG: 3-oxoacyl-ACP reductase family protein [Xanthobacteraceae bacterium]